MKTINKTQFKLLYFMYNRNEYHKTINNLNEAEQAAKLVDMFPDLFIFSSKSFRNNLFSIKLFSDVLPILKYNSKHEKDL